MKNYYVYMMNNKNNTVIYTGVTNDLVLRVYEHKNKLLPGFTSKYNVTKLVYFEETTDINSAIAREKQIKAGSRKKKEGLINNFNKGWVDLSVNI
ncbi:GIY-YIG nuclease family protein [Bacteroidota bacterium]